MVRLLALRVSGALFPKVPTLHPPPSHTTATEHHHKTPTNITNHRRQHSITTVMPNSKIQATMNFREPGCMDLGVAGSLVHGGPTGPATLCHQQVNTSDVDQEMTTAVTMTLARLLALRVSRALPPKSKAPQAGLSRRLSPPKHTNRVTTNTNTKQQTMHDTVKELVISARVLALRVSRALIPRSQAPSTTSPTMQPQTHNQTSTHPATTCPITSSSTTRLMVQGSEKQHTQAQDNPGPFAS